MGRPAFVHVVGATDTRQLAAYVDGQAIVVAAGPWYPTDSYVEQPSSTSQLLIACSTDDLGWLRDRLASGAHRGELLDTWPQVTAVRASIAEAIVFDGRDDPTWRS